MKDKTFLRASLRKRCSAAICDLVIDSKNMVRGKIKVSPRASLMVNNFSPSFFSRSKLREKLVHQVQLGTDPGRKGPIKAVKEQKKQSPLSTYAVEAPMARRAAAAVLK